MSESDYPAVFFMKQNAYDWKTRLYGRIARTFYALFHARKAFLAEYTRSWHEFNSENGLDD